MGNCPKIKYNGEVVKTVRINMAGTVQEVYDWRIGGKLIYHTHQGNSSTRGGCYTAPVNYNTYCGNTTYTYESGSNSVLDHTCWGTMSIISDDGTVSISRCDTCGNEDKNSFGPTYKARTGSCMKQFYKDVPYELWRCNSCRAAYDSNPGGKGCSNVTGTGTYYKLDCSYTGETTSSDYTEVKDLILLKQ